jgi:alcohol dehydrogenase
VPRRNAANGTRPCLLRPIRTSNVVSEPTRCLTLPPSSATGAFAAGLGDHKIVTTLCPGGKECMRRLMGVIAARRIELGAMVTHRFRLDDIEAAYELIGHQRDGVLKVAITP